MRVPFEYALTCAAALLSTADAIPWVARHGLTRARYEETSKSLQKDGYAASHIDTFTLDGTVRYAGIWEKTRFTTRAQADLTAEQYNETFLPLEPDMGPVTARAYTNANGEIRFTSLWSARYSGTVDLALTRAELTKRLPKIPKSCGKKIHSISGYQVNGESRYTVLWESFTYCRQARFDLSATEFWAAQAENTMPGCHWTIRSINVYTVGGQPRFAVVWQGDKLLQEEVIKLDMSSSQFQHEFTRLVKRGLKLTYVSGYAVNGAARYVGVWQK